MNNDKTDKKDALDGGVPMAPQAENAPKRTGPEDAADNDAFKRGDYANRMTGGESLTSELIPEAERIPGGPIARLVPQFPRAAEIGVNPAGKKGGVDQ
jgi:hypothetical protein